MPHHSFANTGMTTNQPPVLLTGDSAGARHPRERDHHVQDITHHHGEAQEHLEITMGHLQEDGHHFVEAETVVRNAPLVGPEVLE